jgi:hypothetical protein
MVVAVVSGLFHATAYLDYNRKIISGEIKPNGATWAIWSIIAAVSTSSYFVSSGDFWKNIIPLVNVVLCLWTFVLGYKRFKRLSDIEMLALGLGIVAVGVWKISTPTYANYLVQVAIAIGFYPTYKMVWKDPESEMARPWWIWSGGYSIMIIVITLRWKHQWSDLVYPVNCAILHGLVPIIAILSRKFKPQTRTTF